MEVKKGKYDTNPLDPEVARNTEEVWGDTGEQADTEKIRGATRPVTERDSDSARANVYSEAPTRRIDNPPLDAPYPSVFVPPTYSPPAAYQSPAKLYQQPSTTERPSSRSVPGIGLPEKWAAMLPYTPAYIGVVVSLLELFLVPRKEVKVRFHAAQGLALHIAILLVQTLFGVVAAVTGSSIGGTLFRVAAFIFLIISMARVWKGEPHRIAPLAEPAQWFNQHIEQRR